jgi:hypothetical protein
VYQEGVLKEADVHNEMRFRRRPVIAMDLKDRVYACVCAGEIWLGKP